MIEQSAGVIVFESKPFWSSRSKSRSDRHGKRSQRTGRSDHSTSHKIDRRRGAQAFERNIPFSNFPHPSRETAISAQRILRWSNFSSETTDLSRKIGEDAHPGMGSCGPSHKYLASMVQTLQDIRWIRSHLFLSFQWPTEISRPPGRHPRLPIFRWQRGFRDSPVQIVANLWSISLSMFYRGNSRSRRWLLWILEIIVSYSTDVLSRNFEARPLIFEGRPLIRRLPQGAIREGCKLSRSRQSFLKRIWDLRNHHIGNKLKNKSSFKKIGWTVPEKSVHDSQNNDWGIRKELMNEYEISRYNSVLHDIFYLVTYNTCHVSLPITSKTRFIGSQIIDSVLSPRNHLPKIVWHWIWLGGKALRLDCAFRTYCSFTSRDISFRMPFPLNIFERHAS
jgi:hypothetical protein